MSNVFHSADATFLVSGCVAPLFPCSLIAFRFGFFMWSKESTQCVHSWARRVPVIPAFAGNSFVGKLPVGPFSFFHFFHVLIFLSSFFGFCAC